ncbi:MAG: InlB B-repeat-containing protein [Muricomes sp.]
MKKNFKRWLALLLAVIMVATSAVYSSNTSLKATNEDTVGQEDVQAEPQTADEGAGQADVQQNDSDAGTQAAGETESTADSNGTQEIVLDAQSEDAGGVVSDSAEQAKETPSETAEQKYNVVFHSSAAEGGSIKTWIDGDEGKDVTYSSGGTQIEGIAEGALLNAAITVNEKYTVDKVADQNGNIIAPVSVNGNVFSYQITISENKEITVSYKEVPQESHDSVSPDTGTTSKDKDTKITKGVIGDKAAGAEDELTYTLSVEFVYEKGGRVQPTVRMQYNPGESYEVQIPAKDGYTTYVDGQPASGSISGTIDADKLIQVVYIPASVGYTVTHRMEQLDGSYIEEKESKSGFVGDMTQAAARSITGYKASDVENVEIGTAQNIDIVITYQLNEYVVRFNTNGGSYVPTQYVKHGAVINLNQSGIPARIGYDFSKWYADADLKTPVSGQRTITGDTTYYAGWTAKTASYTIAYWKESLTEGIYDYAESVTKTATVGNKVNGSGDKSYDYFHYSKADQKVEVKPDGSTIVNVYYDRNVYTLKFNLNNKNVTLKMGGTNYKNSDYTFTAKIGEDISAKWPLGNNITGNTTPFYGWERSGSSTLFVSKRIYVTEDMLQSKDDGSTTTYKANYQQGNTVELHYMLQNANDNDYTDSPLYRQSAVTSGNFSAKAIDGFTNTKTETKTQNKVTHYYFYYDRSSYKLTFNNYNKIDKTLSLRFEQSIGTANYTPARPDVLNSYYEFAGWYTTPECLPGSEFVFENAVMPKNNLVLYAKWEAPVRTVTFSTDEGTAIASQEIKAGDTATQPEDPEKDGYVFEGWYISKEYNNRFDFAQPIEKDIVIYAKWKQITNTTYTIKYLNKADNTEVHSSITKNGKVGTTVYVYPIAHETLVPTSGSESLKLSADSSKNVITFYYSAPSDIYYKVQYLEAGTDKVLKDAFVQKVSLTRVIVTAPDIEGYEPENVKATLDLAYETTEEGIESNVITFYYIPITSTITSSAVHGLITPSGDTKVGWKKDITYTYQAHVGYVLSSVVVDGIDVTESNPDSYTFKKVTSKHSIVVSYTAVQSSYKVEHYLQNAAGDGYTLSDTDAMTGLTDSEVTAAEKNYPGFTFDKDAAGTVLTGNIAGDGSLVLKLYYTRNEHKVTYKYAGDVPESADVLPADALYKFGASVTVADTVTVPGYTFTWDKSGTFEMPDEDVTITGTFKANADTEYKVQYYQQNLEDDNYTLAETDTRTGTTGQTAAAEEKSYEGFALDKTVEGTNASGIIAGDGSLVLKLYYTRNQYEVKYSYVGQVPAGASELPAAQKYKYGANVTVADDAAAPGYNFSGWSIQSESFHMPAENVFIQGQFTAGLIQYTVIHYQENLGGTGYTESDRESMTGTTDTKAIALPKSYEGFKWNPEVQGTKAAGIITADGKLELRLYYTRQGYTVTYQYTGEAPAGASDIPAVKEYKFGSPVTVAEPAAAPGYTFSGWSSTNFNMPAENVVITGSFTANENTGYKVEHYLQNLSGDEYSLEETENFTGTTDAEVTAGPKSYPGFTFDGNIPTGKIAGNGGLVLKLYYTRNSYQVNYSYLGTVPEGASELPESASYKYGESVTIAQPANAPGYTFSGWSQSNFTMPAANVEITGSFTANGDTEYKVEHYLQNLSGDGYSLKDTENLKGTTGTEVAASAKDYPGFTFDGNIASGKVAGDGSLVLKLYYTRNSYQVSYEYDGDVPEGASGLPASASYKYGAEVKVAEKAAASGYTFNGWNRDDFEMPAENVIIKGSFAANGDTKYKVEHYLENLEGNGYNLDKTEELTGETGAAVTAVPGVYEGFKYSESVTGNQAGGNIKGDGSLTLKLYYTRNSYNVVYKYSDTTVPNGASELPTAASYKYGAIVEIADAATAPGYTFSGWSRADDFEMPAADVEITGSFTANEDTGYKVEHYLQNLAGNGYDLAKTDKLEGITDTVATAIASDEFEGFTFNNQEEQNILSGVITGDGSLTLKLYYTRNSYDVTYSYTGTVPDGASTLPQSASYKNGADVAVAAQATAPGYTFSGWSQSDFTMPAQNVEISGSFTANKTTPYKVEYYLQNLAGNGYDLDETKELTGETDTVVTAAEKSYTGFTFDSTVEGTVLSDKIAGDGSLVLKLYYTRNSYQVSYSYLGTVPDGASGLPSPASHKFGEPVTVAGPAAASGYTFSGWNRENFTMPAQNVEISGSFTANGDTRYTVEHYLQNLTGDGYALDTTEQFTGETGTAVTAVPKVYEGFTYDKMAEGTLAEGNIAGDGSLTLKLYYTRNSYNVTYNYTGTIPGGASALPETASYRYGEDVAVAAPAAAPGYTFSGWSSSDFTMPAENVVITGSFAANEATSYKVEHYLQNPAGNGYDLARTDELNGVTDSVVTATAGTFEGFSYDGTIAGTLRSGTITADGNLVLKLYYIRNSYNITIHYVYSGTLAAAAPDYTGKYLYQEQFTVPSPEITGYTRDYASISSGEKGMPAGNLEFTVTYTATLVPPVIPVPPVTPTTPTTPVPPVTPTAPVIPAAPAAPAVVPVTVTAVTPGAPAVTIPQTQIPAGEINAEVTQGENGDYELTPIADTETPLANTDLDDHACCILHFLLMLLALLVLILYTKDMKKRQARIFELREELELKKAKGSLGGEEK